MVWYQTAVGRKQIEVGTITGRNFPGGNYVLVHHDFQIVGNGIGCIGGFRLRKAIRSSNIPLDKIEIQEFKIEHLISKRMLS